MVILEVGAKLAGNLKFAVGSRHAVRYEGWEGGLRDRMERRGTMKLQFNHFRLYTLHDSIFTAATLQPTSCQTTGGTS